MSWLPAGRISAAETGRGVSAASMRVGSVRAVHFSIIAVSVIVTVCLATLLFRAEAVEHHGFNVNIHGSYSECLSCHDDTVARSIPQCMGVCLLGESHPVNRIYPPPDRSVEFRTVSDAEQSGIKFVDGKIDCISCHNLRANYRNHLRVRIDGNQLCFTCHIK